MGRARSARDWKDVMYQRSKSASVLYEEEREMRWRAVYKKVTADASQDGHGDDRCQGKEDQKTRRKNDKLTEPIHTKKATKTNKRRKGGFGRGACDLSSD
jgi:hypothetical protein